MANGELEPSEEEVRSLLETMRACERRMGKRFRDYYIPAQWYSDTFNLAPNEEELRSMVTTMRTCERRMGAKFKEYYVPVQWYSDAFKLASETELYALRRNIANIDGKVDREGLPYLRAVTEHYVTSFPEVFYKEYASRSELFKLERELSDQREIVSEFESFKASLRRRIRSLDCDEVTSDETRRVTRKVLQDVADEVFGGRRFYDERLDQGTTSDTSEDEVAN